MSKKIVLFSITSDIGTYIAKHFYKKNYEVYGTYRNKNSLIHLKELMPKGKFYQCDAANSKSIDSALTKISKEIENWNILVSCPCTPVPIEKFKDSDINIWEKSFYLNSIAQLRFLHGLLKFRNLSSNLPPLALFFAGGGTNNAVDSFSAYTSAKIHLIKMFEFLAYEDKSTKYSIIGPGWTNTKTHYETLKNSKKSSKKYKEVEEFLKNPKRGTPLQDIVDCIEWIYAQEIKVVTGRNFSVVNDQWRGENTIDLINSLKNDDDMYKLRRSGNDIKFI
tara:strand:- start:143 stop:976 length:834 start_codon:yes stop_codon:yes gene_type:complete